MTVCGICRFHYPVDAEHPCRGEKCEGWTSGDLLGDAGRRRIALHDAAPDLESWYVFSSSHNLRDAEKGLRLAEGCSGEATAREGRDPDGKRCYLVWAKHADFDATEPMPR